MDSHNDFNCTWIRSEKQIDKCLDLMRKNASDAYMTVEDLRCGRLTEDLIWKDDLEAIIRNEVLDHDSGIRMGSISFTNTKMAGMFIVRVNRELKFGELIDIVVEEEFRDLGIGKKILEWIEKNFQKEGLKNIVLESGINNIQAHRFFQKNGFKEHSVEFIKSL